MAENRAILTQRPDVSSLFDEALDGLAAHARDAVLAQVNRLGPSLWIEVLAANEELLRHVETASPADLLILMAKMRTEYYRRLTAALAVVNKRLKQSVKQRKRSGGSGEIH